MYSLNFSYGYVLSVCLPVYTSHFTFILITVLVNRGIPGKATAKAMSPAPPPKGHSSFWKTRGSFAAMVLVLSYSLLWRPLAQLDLSLLQWHKPSDTGTKGSSEGSGATTTGRTGLLEPEAVLFGKINPHLLSVGVRCSDTCGPFSCSLRTTPVVGFLTHGVEQPFFPTSSSSRLLLRWKCLHKAKYKASLRIGLDCASCLLGVWKQHKLLFCFII